MIKRLSLADRVGGVAAAIAVVVSFFAWYSYSDGASQISVNGFRASLLGDVFFAASVAFAVLIAARAKLLHVGHVDAALWRVVAGVGLAAVALQVAWGLVVGHNLHKALIIALLAAIAMFWAATQQGVEHRAHAASR